MRGVLRFRLIFAVRTLCVLTACFLFVQLAPNAQGAQAPRKEVRVIVALCDNIHQRIVPVRGQLGNGSNPDGNLYWGAMYGVKSYMRRQPGWTLERVEKNQEKNILERLVLRHEQSGLTVIADAYRGSAIKAATVDFLEYCAGTKNSAAGLVIYIGHNGLMDFSLKEYPVNTGKETRQTVILACRGKDYFAPALKNAGAYPLLWTTGNMAPEAYTLEAVLKAWSEGLKGEDTREHAAQAYHKYQKCGLGGARRLFATGWQ